MCYLIHLLLLSVSDAFVWWLVIVQRFKLLCTKPTPIQRFISGSHDATQSSSRTAQYKETQSLNALSFDALNFWVHHKSRAVAFEVQGVGVIFHEFEQGLVQRHTHTAPVASLSFMATTSCPWLLFGKGTEGLEGLVLNLWGHWEALLFFFLS